jgi:hypothetical protein
MNKTSHLLTLIILSVLIIGFLSIIIYFYLNINKWRTEAAVYEAEIAVTTAVVQSSINAKGQKTTDDPIILRNYFISPGQEFKLIETIENMCASTNLSCKINPVGIEAEQIHLTVDSQGRFSNTFQFISALENLPYKSKISKIELNSGEIEQITENGTTTTTTKVKTWNGHYDIFVGILN